MKMAGVGVCFGEHINEHVKGISTGLYITKFVNKKNLKLFYSVLLQYIFVCVCVCVCGGLNKQLNCCQCFFFFVFSIQGGQ